MKTADAEAAQRASHPLEKAILAKFQTEDDPRALFRDLSLEGAARPLERTLEEEGLLADDAVRRRRLMTAVAAVVFLWGVAAVKGVIAVSRGRYNLWFLLALAVGLAFVAARYSPAHAGGRPRAARPARDVRGPARARGVAASR